MLIPFLIANFLGIHRHYRRAADELAVETPLSPEQIQHQVVVPIGALNRVTIQTLAYAASIAPGMVAPAVTVVHVSDSREEFASLSKAWRAHYWWEQPLHTQTALRLKAALLFRPGTVVTSVPYHLERQDT